MTRSKASICWSNAFQTLPHADLHIYGGEAAYAPYPNERRFRSQLANSPHIRYMGRYDNRELGRILAGIDVVVVPSIWYENAPLVIREAFLARTPVITADFGGMREWVRDGVDGLLFQARDVADLRRQIARCITEPDLVAPALPGVSGRQVDCRRRRAARPTLPASGAVTWDGGIVEDEVSPRYIRDRRQRPG